MTEFWREGFWRQSVNGVVHWVSGHIVSRDGGGHRRLTGAVGSPLAPESTTLARETDEQRAFKLLCPRGCGQEIWFVRPAHGGCFFCDSLGGDWPPHACFPRPEGPGRQAKAAPPNHPAFSATWADVKHPATVLAVWPLASGSALVMVQLNGEGLTLPLIGREIDHWSPCEGKLDFGPRAGCWTFTPSGRSKEARVVFGPIFECRDLAVWESAEGSAAEMLALGRDLGLRRHQHYAGHGLSRYVTPKWRDALRAYRAAITDGDHTALHEAVDLIELPAKGAMRQDQERVLIRLRRELRKATDTEDRDEIMEVFLENFRV